MEQYGHRFDEFSYVKTFEQLKLKYDQAPERAGNGAVEGAPGAAAEAPDAAAAAAAAAAAGGAAANIRGRTIVFNTAGPHRPGMPPYHRRRRRDDRDMGECGGWAVSGRVLQSRSTAASNAGLTGTSWADGAQSVTARHPPALNPWTAS